MARPLSSYLKRPHVEGSKEYRRRPGKPNEPVFDRSWVGRRARSDFVCLVQYGLHVVYSAYASNLSLMTHITSQALLSIGSGEELENNPKPLVTMESTARRIVSGGLRRIQRIAL